VDDEVKGERANSAHLCHEDVVFLIMKIRLEAALQLLLDEMRQMQSP
jgi:hypothetical protein